MKAEIVLTYCFIWLTFIQSSYQDGFNFYKALNRTPMNRVERFYRDGMSSRYKVPLSKRLFYDGSNQRENMNKKLDYDFVTVLLGWTPEMKFSSLNNADKKEDECAQMQNSITEVIFV